MLVSEENGETLVGGISARVTAESNEGSLTYLPRPSPAHRCEPGHSNT